ncbi:MAG: hypothetical protein HKN75_02815 [Bacteroidia bacterium]|nr:hypothetical protein [Bacteroidia bacterium]
MKRKLFAIVFVILIGIPLFVFGSNLNEIRMEFYQITIDSKNTPQLLEKLYAIDNPNAVILAYTAATEAIMAKVAWNPYSKFNYLFKSKETFEKAIQQNDKNIEIRFLRFSVEHHIPKYLGMSKNLQQDKQVILNELDNNSLMTMNEEMLNYTMRFLINSNQCSNEELSRIRKVLSDKQLTSKPD